MFTRSACLLAATGVGVTLAVVPTTAANAAGTHVHVVTTNANCSTSGNPFWTARKVRFQAANGEAVDMDVSFGGFGAADFQNVPAEGETVIAYVYCGIPDDANGPARWARAFDGGTWPKLTPPAIGWVYMDLDRMTKAADHWGRHLQ
jgi:hypothetical protein